MATKEVKVVKASPSQKLKELPIKGCHGWVACGAAKAAVHSVNMQMHVNSHFLLLEIGHFVFHSALLLIVGCLVLRGNGGHQRSQSGEGISKPEVERTANQRMPPLSSRGLQPEEAETAGHRLCAAGLV